jgi:hypothetical protein
VRFYPCIRIRIGKKSGSGINIPDHFSEILGTVFGLKILKFFDADPGSGSCQPGIRVEKVHPGSVTLRKKWNNLIEKLNN